MRNLTLCVLLCAMAVNASAQKYGDPKFKQKFTKADALIYDGSYMKALPLLEDLYAYDTSNANLNYKLGVCYLLGKKDHNLAIKRLESATHDVSLDYNEASWKERKAPGKAYYYLGRAYHFKNRFDRAINNYYNYRSFIELDDVETYNEVRQQIQYAENAMELIKHPVGVKISNLGPTINTKYPEYCPIVSADGQVLIFTSRRPGGTSNAKDDNNNYYEDIYICKKQPNGKWGAPKGIGSNINTTGHEAAIGLSPDGQLLFIYKDDNNDGNIYYSRKEGEDWSKPQPMGSDINTKAWETHATVNATQDLLIFVSNRDGGFGGRDLWYSKRLPDGNWGLAQNMGSVLNSQFEEDSPSITADGKTLIFSSQGHTSMGGFDIFRSEFDEGAWTAPENIGYPINTSEDDVFFVLTPDGRSAYYSSKRDGGYGETDLYYLKLEKKKAKGLAVARGIMKVPAMAYADISAKIVVTDEGGAQIGTYRPNSSTGYYVLILNPGETYTVSYQADGYETITAQVPVSSEEIYSEYDGTVELKEVVFGENILALQEEKARLEKEKEATASAAAEQDRLAQEALEKAKREAEELALEKSKEGEIIKAERLATKEKEKAAQELFAAQELAKNAEIDRKKAEETAAAELAAKEKRLTDEEAQRLKDEQEFKQAEKEALAKEAAVAAQKQTEQEAADQVAAAAAQKQAEQEAAAKEAAAAAQKQTEQEAAAKEAATAAQKQTEQEAAAKEAATAAQKQAEQEAAAKEAAAAAQKQAEQETADKEAATAAQKQAEQEAAAKEAATAAQKQAEQEAAAKEAAAAASESDSTKSSARSAQLTDEQLAQAQKFAEVERKRQELQQRIAELKEEQRQKKQANVKVKEVAVQKMNQKAEAIAVDTKAINAKREAMLKRIEELKKRKTEVEKQKVVDEGVVVQATEKEKAAIQKKKELVQQSEQKKEKIEALNKELNAVVEKVGQTEQEIQAARIERQQAEVKVEEDVKEVNKVAEEALKKKEEAEQAAQQLKDLEELEHKRIEEEELAAAQFEKEQREEAERTKTELIQLEALAEQQEQVAVALKLEEEKKKKIDAAQKDAYSQQEILDNASTLDQLRELNRQLIQDNLDLKKQLAELNKKLDIILARLDYTPDIQKVKLPANATMKNLQEGRRLILRNIFFDYNLASLRSKSKHELNKLYGFMKDNPDIDIVVSGHTDSRGNDDYNMRLSKDRAQAVVNYLVRNGIAAKRLTSVGYGETRPIARNENPDLSDNPMGRQLNRRIEISLPPQASKKIKVEEITVPKNSRISK